MHHRSRDVAVSGDAKFSLIVNAQARAGRPALERARDQLLRRGIKLMGARLVTEPFDLKPTVREVLAAGSRLLIVGGGDGTLSSVCTLLAHSEVTLGVIPLGTANDFARTVGIPTGVDRACDVIADGQVVDVDLGMLDGMGVGGADHVDHYLNVASIGLGAVVAGAMSTRAKRLLGPLAYPLATLKAAVSARSFMACLTLPAQDTATGPARDTATGTGPPVGFRARPPPRPPLGSSQWGFRDLDDVLHIAVGNGRFYGGGRAVSVTAGIDDAALDVYVVTRGRPWELLRVARRLKGGDFSGLASVVCYRADEVRIETQPLLPLNVDGELRGQHTPVRVAVARNALRVLVPAGSTAARLDDEDPL